jgi:dTDP-4-dehydrorhamnose reductase
MARFLVTGASGLLGINFSLQAMERGHEVTGTVNQHGLKNAPFQVFQAELSKPGLIGEIIAAVRPDVIIHTAAIAVIDGCEKQPELSWRLNAELPGEIAQIAQKKGIQMVHISTDAVFDGVEGHYDEDSQPNPLSMYARHKLEGERTVLEANPDAAVARVNFFGWSLTGSRSLSEWFYKNLSEGRPSKGFKDAFFCPLLVNDLSDLLMKMVENRLKGIYHVLSPAYMSKYAFGVLIAKQFGFDPTLITPTSWKEGGLLAMRSPNLILKVDKLINDLGLIPPVPEEGIRCFHQLWQNGYADRVRSMRTPDL